MPADPFFQWSIAEVWGWFLHLPYLGGTGVILFVVLLAFVLILLFR